MTDQAVWRKTLAGAGVKLSLMWIGLLVIAGVFAPFLANSMPLIMHEQGQLSLPVLHYLSVEDVVVLSLFGLALL